MKQLTEAQLAELLKKAYLDGFSSGISEMVEDAEPDEFVDLESLDAKITVWVDSV
ncbi:MAG: hypothetical protein RR740_00505 [Pseudomonas sp.]